MNSEAEMCLFPERGRAGDSDFLNELESMGSCLGPVFSGLLPLRAAHFSLTSMFHIVPWFLLKMPIVMSEPNKCSQARIPK